MLEIYQGLRDLALAGCPKTRLEGGALMHVSVVIDFCAGLLGT